MKKFLLSLIALATLCVSNAWGDTDYNITGSGTNLTLNITGTGAMPDYDNTVTANRVPWYSSRSSIKHVVIADGVTSVGQYAFEGTKVADITIPVSCKSFGIKAFANRGETPSSNNIYYKGTPNQWADITFALDGSYPTSHPFYNVTAANNHIYFYDQKTSENKIIVFSEGLETINSYVFWFAGNITDLCIPHSVSLIKTKAFSYCSNLASITVLNTSAPNTETDAINHIKSESYLYLPKNANASTSAPGFKRTPWYDSSSSGAGAKYIGSNSTDHTVSNEGNNFGGSHKVYATSGSNSDFSWELDMTGVLTIEGNGSIETSYSGSNFSNSNVLPWGRFRRMITKIIINPNGEDFTDLGNVLRYHYSLDTIIVNQTTIPTHSFIISETNNTANNFDKLFDQRKNVTLKIKAASLTDANVSNLAAEPWSNAKLDIQLSDNLVISDENTNNTTLLANCSTYVKKPITLQLNRTLIVDGEQYNTFCSPIALTAAQLNDADIRALVSSSLDGDELTLTFSEDPLDAIDAGKPYLVKPSSELANPTFTNIAPNSLVSTTTNTETEYVDFIGVLAPTLLTGGDKNTLFLGADNELLWPEADASIKGMRAYFSVKGEAQQAAKRARIVMNKDAATGLQNTEHRTQTQKILRDGQIIIIRDGKEYNVMGKCK